MIGLPLASVDASGRLELTSERVGEIRQRILEGAYNSLDVVDEVARRMLERGRGSATLTETVYPGQRRAEGCDLLVHTAAIVGMYSSAEGYWETNVVATRLALDAAVSSGARVVDGPGGHRWSRPWWP